MLTLYDISSSLPNRIWAPNVIKTYYSLAYKGLAYQTVFMQFYEVEAKCKELCVKPTKNHPDGTPWYTFPVIHDSSTGVAVAESFFIAQYLDKAYPNTPRLLPDGSDALQFNFIESFEKTKVFKINHFAILSTYNAIAKEDSAAGDAFRRTWEDAFAAKLEDVAPSAEKYDDMWKEFEAGLDWLEELISINGGGSHIMGDIVSFADFVVAGRFQWVKLVNGPGSREWKALTSCHGGRWAKLVDECEQLCPTA